MDTTVVSKYGKLPVKSDVVEVGLWKMTEYHIELDASAMGWNSKVSYIEGINPGHTALEPTEIVIFDSNELINSLIALSNDVVSYRKREKKLIEWMKKYGLPLVDIDTSQKKRTFICPLWKFMNFLFELRDVILKIEAINSGNASVTGNSGQISNPYMGSKSWTDERIENLIADWINDAVIYAKIGFENHSPYLALATDSVLSAAKYQLALLLLCNEGITPRRCMCCNSYFIPDRENKKYCPYCTPQKFYAKKKRTLKKQSLGGLVNG